MSLLKRFLGLDTGEDDSEPESPALSRIIEVLEGLPRERAHYLAAFACVLARVANADLSVEDSEVDAMVRATASLGNLTEDESKLVVEIAKQHSCDEGGTANYLVTRDFRDISSREQRSELIECLYAVSAADQSISMAESSEVLKIAGELGLSRNETNAIRAGWKDHLAEFQNGVDNAMQGVDTRNTKGELENYIEDMEEKLNSVGDDAQLANVDLQNMLQKQQQTMQMMSNIAKMLHDTAMSIIRKIGG